MEVVNVLESSNKVWLAQQVRDMLSESSLQRAGDKDLQIRQGPFMTRYFYFTVIWFFDFLLHCVDTQTTGTATSGETKDEVSHLSMAFFTPSSKTQAHIFSSLFKLTYFQGIL